MRKYSKYGVDLNFYPRSPRGERPYAPTLLAAAELFLSTLPAWGATTAQSVTRTGVTYFYPRSPRGERRYTQTF